MTDVLTPVSTISLGPLARWRASKWAALPVLLAGTCLIVLDFFIVNVAMASMQRDLHAGATAVEWVVAGYGLTFAVFLLAAGRLGDRVGRRRMFATGVAVFTVASLACGLAPTPEVLVLARLVQGIGGAMISPSVLALIGTLYAGPDRGRAIGIYATVMGLAAAGGQLVGGVLLHLDVAGLGWRTVFLINVPIGIAALVVVRRVVPESRATVAARIDVVGVVLATLALTALVLPLVDGRAHGWPTWSLVSLALSPVLLADFVWWQRRMSRRHGEPLVDPSWFRSRVFSVGMLTQLAFWTGQASYFLVLALYLQLGRGLSAMQSGLVFSVLAAAYLVASMKAATLVARWGRSVVVTGAAVLAAGHVSTLLAVELVHGDIAVLAPGLLLAGAGMGLCLAPITTLVLTGVDPQRAGAVSGLLSTMQQVGNAVGVAVIGVLFFGSGYVAGFEVSTAALAVLLLAVAGCARCLPARG
ncbi:MAG TPA: MFS transporter [Mycobacteriales bacterium]|nr:MFS transporter [Mycobacteriales bacterium]